MCLRVCVCVDSVNESDLCVCGRRAEEGEKVIVIRREAGREREGTGESIRMHHPLISAFSRSRPRLKLFNCLYVLFSIFCFCISCLSVSLRVHRRRNH